MIAFGTTEWGRSELLILDEPKKLYFFGFGQSRANWEVMRVSIAFARHKGGTGKTTSCINISGYLALRAKKVLVIDLDQHKAS